MKYTAALAIFLFLGGIAHGISWVYVRKNDPISSNTVTVSVPESFGSYIYSWPSKYDLVFWPLTDPQWIWFCRKSGFASFGYDFDKLSKEEKVHLNQWLKKNYKPSEKELTHQEKLMWLEKVYAQRNKDDGFWCCFYRLMAYAHMCWENPKKSLEYVKKALPLLEKSLKEEKEGIDRMATLFLLGEYNRRLGKDSEAQRYFDQAKSEKFSHDNEEEKRWHDYYLGLVKAREELMIKASRNK